MKRGLCLFCAFLILLIAALSATAATPQTSSVYKSADDTGAYVVRFSGKHADITRYASRDLSVGLDLQYKINAVCAYRNRVVLFCDDTKNDQLIVYVYQLITDVLDSFSILHAKLYANTDFGCDNNAIYLENDQNNKELTAYSYSGDLLSRYHFQNEITGVFGGFHSDLFAAANNTLYRLTGDRFTAISGGSVKTPLFPVDSDIAASSKGVVYVLDGDRITRSFTVDADQQAVSACTIGGRLYYPDGAALYGYDVDTGEKVSYCSLSHSAPLIFSNGNQVIAIGDTNQTAVKTEQFTELQQPAQDASGGTGNTSGDVSGISSGVYRVDFDQYRITGIPAGATIANFKSNMNYSGYTLTLYRGNTVKKSGSVGTGMTAVFTNGSSSITFELSIVGDITGEGNCNSRDLNMLMDYLLGSLSFNGVYLSSADVSGDKAVNAVDMAVMKQMIS